MICIWITGLSGAGKTTIAYKLSEILPDSVIIDGDEIRKLNPIGFSKTDRDANVMTAANMAVDVVAKGHIAICSLVSPYKETRNKVRLMFERFIEIFVDTPLEVCEARDIKGLYAKARLGEIQNFTGISDPYEVPENPEIVLQNGTVEEYVSIVIRAISAIS